ncbi:HNH endonuclease signature motif containing protein [Microbispora bryophytorum]|uniref:HNH endonuclease n=1 Tax=Microbispora bryophytorum TaxID=1460882 RepID=UPI0033CE7E18
MSREGIDSRTKRQLRAAVLRRDGWRCFYCWHRFRGLSEVTLDHLVPRSQGGPWTAANLVVACAPCNEAKADRPPAEFLRPRGFMPGLRPRGLETARRAVTGTARAGRTAALVPAAVVALVLMLGDAA